MDSVGLFGLPLELSTYRGHLVVNWAHLSQTAVLFIPSLAPDSHLSHVLHFFALRLSPTLTSPVCPQISSAS